METKACSGIELKGEPEGTFTALISTFNRVDKHGDLVRPGAFRASLDAWRATGARVPVVYSHRADDVLQHVGDCDPADIVESSTGLQASGRFYLDEVVAHKVFRQLKRKALSQWSFGYIVRQSKPLPGGGRELLAVDLLELGPTLIGAGQTHTVDVKGHTPARADPYAAHRAALDRALKRLAITLATR
jgi:HK97 family phage prohead protease